MARIHIIYGVVTVNGVMDVPVYRAALDEFVIVTVARTAINNNRIKNIYINRIGSFLRPGDDSTSLTVQLIAAIPYGA